jgi:hypothetical protein
MALGDRRARVRLEVVGALWATLELSEPARVVNISRDGALITSPVAMPPDSIQPLHLKLHGHDITVDARVRHVRRVSGPDEPRRRRVLVHTSGARCRHRLAVLVGLRSRHGAESLPCQVT